MGKKFTLICGMWGLLLFSLPLQAQISFWQQYLGGAGFDAGKRIMHMPDGTLVLAGETLSSDGLGEENHGQGADVVIAKYATQGSFLWRTLLGGSGHDEIADLIRTEDGGYAMIGTSRSIDGDPGGNQGGTDVWVVKLDARGRKVWSRTFGGSGDDRGAAIIETPHGFFIGGESSSVNGDMRSPHHGGLDSWIGKLTHTGRLLWEKHYGGSGNEKVCRLHLINDELMVINSTDSRDQQVAASLGAKDAWIITLDELGEMLWQGNFGGEGNDDVHGSVIDSEGNILIAGTTFSTRGYIKEQKGKGDFWLMKMAPGGAVLWSQTYGGSQADGANGVSLAQDGNYLICGMTKSVLGLVPNNAGYYDGWIGKVHKDGRLIWSRTVGFSEKDALFDAIEVPEGGFLAIGYTQQALKDQAQPGHHGSMDLWICNFADPERGMAVRPYRTPAVMMGKVVDKENLQPLDANLLLTDNKTLDSLSATKTDAEDGSFVLLMPAYGLVSVNVLTPGYLFYGYEMLMDTIFNKTLIERTFLLEPIRINSSLVLENVYFNTGKWDLLPTSFAELERIVAFMKLNPRVVVEVSGHTDNTGNKNQKVELSLRRAKAVKAYLVTKGVEEFRLKVKGFGMYRPRATNKTPQGRRRNRRVEFKVLMK
ncbi:MAG: OmpA family protein [Bacteroidota bacterium]